MPDGVSNVNPKQKCPLLSHSLQSLLHPNGFNHRTALVSPRFVHLAWLRMTLRRPAYRGLFGFAFALPASSPGMVDSGLVGGSVLLRQLCLIDVALD